MNAYSWDAELSLPWRALSAGIDFLNTADSVNAGGNVTKKIGLAHVV